MNVTVNIHMQLAADEYVEKRAQLGSRAAAAHVTQKYGITSRQLSEYLRAQGSLLQQERAVRKNGS